MIAYRLGIIFRCLILLGIGALCASVIAANIGDPDGDGILVTFFMLCVYAGAVCGCMGNRAYFGMMLGIQNLGCIGMAVWAVAVACFSIILIPIVIAWQLTALFFNLFCSSINVTRILSLKKVICCLLSVLFIGGVALYYFNIFDLEKVFGDKDNGGDVNLTYVDKTSNKSYTDITHNQYIVIAGGVDMQDGRTPLHRAALAGDSRQVSYLIQQGANVYDQDSYGNTPLHLAAAAGHDSCVRLLVEACRYNLHLINRDGKTAYDVAIQNKNYYCAEIIREYL